MHGMTAAISFTNSKASPGQSKGFFADWAAKLVAVAVVPSQFCLFVCFFVCVFVCLFVWFVCLFVCFVCLSGFFVYFCLFVCLLVVVCFLNVVVCLVVRLFVCLFVCGLLLLARGFVCFCCLLVCEWPSSGSGPAPLSMLMSATLSS